MVFEKCKELWQRQILADSNLTHATRNVAIAISVHLNRNSRIAWPGRVRLAKMVAVTVKTVQRAIAELERAGHLHVLRSRNGVKSNANRYVPILKREGTHVSPQGTYVSRG
jgi:DNA-binding transcriptional regulator YhcF (GntR family)